MNALLAYVNDSDFRVNHRLVAWHPPRWFRLWMVAATRLGDGWLWLATGLCLLAAGGRGRDVLGAAAVATALANGLLVALKRRVRRPRPRDAGAGPPFGPRYRPHFSGDAFSFPSGHSLNAFALGTVVALGFPALAPLTFLVAASVAASRVFLGFHFLTDVVAGAALGAALGASAFELMLR
jgi:undecaprenyl-diphosphatase